MDNITSPKFVSSSLGGTQNPVFNTPKQSQPVQPQQSSGIDYGALTLARSIALKESSKDGTTPNYQASGDAGTSYGAYQWNNGKKPLQPGQLPVNFTSAAKQYGLDPNDFSPQNQDKVAYAQVKALKDQGLQPDQIAASWNAGMGHINDWQNHKGTTEINGQQIQYDTPGYVKGVQDYYTKLSQTNPPPTQQDSNQQTQPQENSPSIGGFLNNTIQSGANFIGGLGEAVLHPIQTAQNLGSTALGGVEKLGGQDNENTQKFDALTSFFKERYGGIDNIKSSLYKDPVGVLADLSAVLGVGGGALGVLGKGAELGGLGEVADTASKASSILGKGAELTNPLTPVIKGVGKALSKSGDLLADTAGEVTNLKGSTVKNAFEGKLTPENIENTSRTSVAQDIEKNFQEKLSQFEETGAGYAPIRNSAQYTEVAPDALAKLIEKNAGVTIDEGGVVQTSGKVFDPKDVKALQNLYDTYNPKFASGELTASEFHDLRQYVNNKLAKFDREITSSSDLKRIGGGIYKDLNNEYRKNFPGLEELDSSFSAQAKDIESLRKGLFDKDGNLLDSAINKIANATGKGKDKLIARIEAISPGATEQIKILKSIEDITKETSGSGNSLLRSGGLLASLGTGRLDLIGLAIASNIIDKPEIAVPLIRAMGANQELVSSVIRHLSQYLTVSSVENKSLNTQQNSQDQNTTAQLPENTPQQTKVESPISSQNTTIDPAKLQALALDKKFNLEGARKDGHTDQEIYDFLTS